MNTCFKLSTNFSSLVSLLDERSRTRADKLAFTYLADNEKQQDNLTFEGLDRRARAIAARLQEWGMSGERALLVYPSGLEFICGLFGCMYAGVTAVPTQPPMPHRSTALFLKVASDSRARVMLSTASLWARVGSILEGVREATNLRVMRTDGIADDSASHWCPPPLDVDSFALLQYTSGSTGVPRGIMLSHGNLLHNQRMLREAFQNGEDEVYVTWLPLFHDMGLIGNVLQTLYLGCRCVLMSPTTFLRSPFRWLSAVSRYGASVSGGPNFAFDLCAKMIAPEQKKLLDLRRWRVAFNGSEVVRAETLERFLEAFGTCGFRREAFLPCYGLAEGTLFVASGPSSTRPVVRRFDTSHLERGQSVEVGGDEGARSLVSCGRTWGNQRIVIADPETLGPAKD